MVGICRITQALFGAAASLSDRVMSQQVLEAVRPFHMG